MAEAVVETVTMVKKQEVLEHLVKETLEDQEQMLEVTQVQLEVVVEQEALEVMLLQEVLELEEQEAMV